MSDARRLLVNSFQNPNPDSYGVFKMLQDVYPAFAEKIFQNNEFMKQLVMSGYSPIHIMDYPICGHCETLAALSGYAIKYGKRVDVCTCLSCHSSTTDPITFRDWLIIELKKKVPPAYIESMEYAVDAVALKMVTRYFNDTKEIMARDRYEQQKKMGLIDSYGNEIVQERHHEVTLTETNSKIDLEEEAQRIGREENLDVQQADK